jgi:hypothetical protein
MRYELIAAKTNSGTDYLMTRDGQVVSRWADISEPAKWDRLSRETVYDDLDKWDDQAAAGADLSDYQANLDAGDYDVEVLAVEIDGQHPRYIASDAVEAARKELDLPGGLRSPVDYTDAVTAVSALLIGGTLPDWFGGVNWYAKQAAEKAAHNLGVWPWMASQ